MLEKYISILTICNHIIFAISVLKLDQMLMFTEHILSPDPSTDSLGPRAKRFHMGPCKTSVFHQINDS